VIEPAYPKVSAWIRKAPHKRGQALERSAPILPLQPGLAERRSHDYIRDGTSTLFAALEISTGKVTAALKPRHRHQEFLAFLKQVARAYPDQQLHLVMDNYAAHKRTAVKQWLAANPRVVCHFTPTHASWMNLVEVWFSLAERQAIHRGSYTSVRELNAKIRAYINAWNNRCHPFVWTKTAEEILKKANRKKHFKRGALGGHSFFRVTALFQREWYGARGVSVASTGWR
jgi:transposase